MAHRPTTRNAVSDLNGTTPKQAAAVAELLHSEVSKLLKLYKMRETFTKDLEMADDRLVSVTPDSYQLDATDKLWRLNSALLQCRTLLQRAIAKEEEELGGGNLVEYETQRNMVKERLSALLHITGELLKAAGIKTFPAPDLEVVDPKDLHDLKLWVYNVFREVDYWANEAVATLQELPAAKTKERARPARPRSIRNARR